MCNLITLIYLLIYIILFASGRETDDMHKAFSACSYVKSNMHGRSGPVRALGEGLMCFMLHLVYGCSFGGCSFVAPQPLAIVLAYADAATFVNN